MPHFASRPIFPIFRFRRFFCTGLCSLLPLLAGCGEQPEVRRVQVGAMQQEPAQPSRMLGAIIPQPSNSQAWFFKLTGTPEQMEARRADFDAVMKSLRFDASGKSPSWTLPDGWTQRAGSGMRYATLVHGDGADSLEMSVMALPMSDPEDDVLRNVNRWRGQLNLSSIAASELDASTEKLDVDGTSVIVVDITGESSGSSSMMGGAPFASGAGPLAGSGSGQMPAGHPPVGGVAGGAQGGATESLIEYDTPEGWEPGEVRGIRVAAFRVPDGDRETEVTVIPMALAASDVLSNVNIWRGQIGLEATTQEAVSEFTETIDVGGKPATLVHLNGSESATPRQAILAAIMTRPDSVWFVKALGDADQVENEKTRFVEFVQSIKFKEGI